MPTGPGGEGSGTRTATEKGGFAAGRTQKGEEAMNQQGTSTPTGVSGVDPMGSDLRRKDRKQEQQGQDGRCAGKDVARDRQGHKPPPPRGGGGPGARGETAHG